MDINLRAHAKMSQNGESLNKYKTDSFQPLSPNGKGTDRDFVSLQGAEKGPSEFIPITLGGENQTIEFGNGDIFSDPQERAALLEQEAYEKGFAQGEKDGFDLGEKKAAKFVEKIEALFMELSRLKDVIIKQYEKELLDLAFAIAGKITHCQIGSDENVVKHTIINAMGMAVQRNKVVIRVNPEDYDFVDELRPELFSEIKEVKSIIVSSDQSVSRGGCFLETPRGDVDATVEAQMEKIYQSLEEAFNENECVQRKDELG